MNNLRIKITDGKAKLYTPYSRDFVEKIHNIGGAKFNGTETCWEIPEGAVSAAREIMCDVYGHDDTFEDEKLTLRVTVNQTVREKEVTLFSKCLCRAWGRDTGGKCGSDVAYIKGAPSSGGSRTHWDSIVYCDSVILLTNVSKTIYEKQKESVSEYYSFEIVQKEENNKEKLLIEKEALLKRLAEIENLLAE